MHYYERKGWEIERLKCRCDRWRVGKRMIGLLLSSASSLGMKCSNSFSLSAAITSAGWIVFLPAICAYSFELDSTEYQYTWRSKVI